MSKKIKIIGVSILIVVLGVVGLGYMVAQSFKKEVEADLNKLIDDLTTFNYADTLPILCLYKKYTSYFQNSTLKSIDSLLKIFSMFDDPTKNINDFKPEIDKVLKELGINMTLSYSVETFLNIFAEHLHMHYLNPGFMSGNVKSFANKDPFCKNFILLTEDNGIVQPGSFPIMERKNDSLTLEDSLLKTTRILNVPKVFFIYIDFKICKDIMKLDKENQIKIIAGGKTHLYKITGAIIYEKEKFYCLLKENDQWITYDGNKKANTNKILPAIIRIEQ